MNFPGMEELARTYAEMSDDELAELNMRRDSLTPEARTMFDREAARRRENISALTDSKLEEDFGETARRWNDDDLLYFLQNRPVLSPAEQRVVALEVTRRDLDWRTLPPGDPSALEIR